MEIHQFRVDHKKLALDVPSSLCLELDDVADAVLNELALTGNKDHVLRSLSARFSTTDIGVVLQELQELKKRGLFLDDEKSVNIPEWPKVTSLTLNVAHVCNLRCAYCFASEGSYGGQKKKMDVPTARQAIDLLMTLSGSQDQCNVVFFGGEPLLNVPVIKDVLAYGREQADKRGKTISFSMTTNGLLLLDEMIEFLNENKVSILISIDGPKEIQDDLRCLASGEGSYDKLLPRIQALSRRRDGKISARATISHRNPTVRQVVEHLSSIGFARVYCTPVSSACEGNSPLALTDKDVERMIAEYEQLAWELVEAIREQRPFTFGGFLRHLRRIHTAQKKMYSCGAGKTALAVDPEGDVYPCHRFVGTDAFKIGNIFTGLDVETSQQRFLEASVLSLRVCPDCWARYLCSGYCLYDFAKPDGSFGSPDPIHCRLVQREIELSLFIYAKIREGAPETLTQLAVPTPMPHRTGEFSIEGAAS